MYTRCQSSTVASYLTVCKKLKETSENKKHFFEIKTVSRDDVSAKVQKQKFCDSVCYKIPYFTDSCELRILYDSVAKFL